MDLLEPRFLNGRTHRSSCIQLTARWVDGWKFKDGKWKYEEEIFFGHIGEGKFRCRVHLYCAPGTVLSTNALKSVGPSVNANYELDAVNARFEGERLTVTVPLDLEWGETDNESLNPKIFRYFESIHLPLEIPAFFGLQVLITYRNLHTMFGSNRIFSRNPNGTGYTWLGSD
jgi:hypothetical protein